MTKLFDGLFYIGLVVVVLIALSVSKPTKKDFNQYYAEVLSTSKVGRALRKLESNIGNKYDDYLIFSIVEVPTTLGENDIFIGIATTWIRLNSF